MHGAGTERSGRTGHKAALRTKIGHHFVCGVYLLYCADLLLRRSGQNLHSISGNTAFMERYQVMQNDLHSLIAEVSTFARKQMF
jgi:hypothetical protein